MSRATVALVLISSTQRWTVDVPCRVYRNLLTGEFAYIPCLPPRIEFKSERPTTLVSLHAHVEIGGIMQCALVRAELPRRVEADELFAMFWPTRAPVVTLRL